MCHSEQCISGRECRSQTEDASRQSDATHSRAERLQAEDANDALRKWTASRSHREDRRAAPFFHQRECAGILDSVATERHCYVIAAVLALRPNAFVQPPDCGMVEEQRLNTNLENIHKGIEALDVRQFVGYDRLQLFFGEARKRGRWQEHDGTKPSEHRWRLQPRAFAVRNRALQAELILQRVADLENPWANDSRPFAPFALEQQESACGTKTEESDAEKPRLDQPGQRVERRRDGGSLCYTTRHNLVFRLRTCQDERRGLRGVCHAGMLLRIEEESRQRSQEHEHERTNPQQIARGGATAQSHCRGRQSGDSSSLPEEVQESPS